MSAESPSIDGAGFNLASAPVSPPANAVLLAIPVTVYAGDSADGFQIPPSAYGWDGFRRWAISDDFPDRGKITFVDGELIVDMSPESFEEQGAIKAEVSRVLAQLIRDRRLGFYRIDRTLISNKEANLSSEPDGLFLSRDTIKAGRVSFTPAASRPQSSKELVGMVDWVLEIVSPASRRKDQKKLRTAYFKAGIPEYWLIDAIVDDEEQVNFQVLVPGPNGYEPTPSVDGWLPSPTFGCSFKLTRKRDEDGFWEYTLQMQEAG